MSRKGLRWSDDDDAVLRERYANTRNSDLAQHLSRSVDCVQWRAHALGLRKSASHRLATRTFRLGNAFGGHNAMPDGARKLNKDGYILQKVAGHWVLEHRLHWEECNGPVPEGMALKCIDANVRNTHPSNWDLVPRGLLGALNSPRGYGYDAAPAELKPTILALAKLKHVIRSRSTPRSEP